MTLLEYDSRGSRTPRSYCFRPGVNSGMTGSVSLDVELVEMRKERWVVPGGGESGHQSQFQVMVSENSYSTVD